VHADRTQQGLRDWLTAHGVEMLWNTRVHRQTERAGAVSLTTDHGVIDGRQVVFACGAWAGSLLATPLPTRVVRQQVGYFDLAAPPAALRIGDFPVWARIGHTANDCHYGLPATDTRGVKAAVHRTEGPGCDPDSTPPAIDEAALLALATERFAVPVRSLQASEHCLYTMAPDDQLQVVRTSPGTVSITACSGHAFKFGPVIGRLAADLVTGAVT
jgi:sarcosine oxidase